MINFAGLKAVGESVSKPIEYYRKFSSDSTYHYKLKTISGAGYDTAITPVDNIQAIDISYNISILMELQKILASMYFTKH